MLMSVTERVREIGILSALGWNSGRIVLLIVCEGLVLAGAGSLVGAVSGVVALNGLAALPKVAGLIEPAVTARLIIEVIMAAVALGGVGSLYPPWDATRLRPVEALKHE